MKKISKTAKIIDSIMRVLYIGIFTLTGVWALLLPVNYAQGVGITIDQPMGRGEVAVIGGVYLLSAILLLYHWFKKQNSELYKIPTFVTGAIILSRLVSVIKGDFDQQLLLISLSEILLIIWAIWGLKRNMKSIQVE